MIKELAEFGKSIRTGHDALKDEPIDIDLVINDDGSFRSFSPIERILRPAEAITAKKGKARLLLDKAEEVLCFVSPKEIKNAKGDEKKALDSVKRKHELYLKKLNEYAELEILKPVIRFYYENRINGFDVALKSFEMQVESVARNGNIAFRLFDKRIHEQREVRDAIINSYEKDLEEKKAISNVTCAVCGKLNYPIAKLHEKIKGTLPFDSTSSNRVLVSFDKESFESFGLKRSFNAGICTNCAKNYAFGLNYLINTENNRKYFGIDTTVVFWTREPIALDEMDWFEKPDAGSVANLIESVANAKHTVSSSINTNQFYSLTLSGAAARIAIRDWIEISLDEYKVNIARWFKDIRIVHYDFDIKESKLTYPAIGQLTRACSRKEAKDDTTISRVAKHLWNCALKNQAPPLWILSVVLKRIAHSETTSEGKSVNTFTTARASLIRFILNRNHIGGIKMKEELDIENSAPAYLCGRLFCLIEGIQRAALGKDINAGVRERFFSAASTSPSSAFGRLMRLMQNHLTKIRQDKPGLAIVLDTETTELCGKIKNFPMTLNLEQQGQFALGYYHQKHDNFNRAKQNKDFETLTDNNTEEQ